MFCRVDYKQSVVEIRTGSRGRVVTWCPLAKKGHIERHPYQTTRSTHADSVLAVRDYTNPTKPQQKSDNLVMNIRFEKHILHLSNAKAN